MVTLQIVPTLLCSTSALYVVHVEDFSFSQCVGQESLPWRLSALLSVSWYNRLSKISFCAGVCNDDVIHLERISFM